MANTNTYFSSNFTPRQVDKVWDKYVNSGVLLEGTIRGVIGDSWVRCNEAGVDPGGTRTRICLQSNIYQSLLNKNEQLIEAAKPVMEHANHLLAESGSMMILADKEGVCLHVEGDRRTVEDGHEIDLCEGANWSEYAAGTNAIGTVLSVKKPVKVNTTEHFCEGIKSWSCAAMVIRDPGSKEIIGVLDISGLTSSFNHHALALVVEAAGRIESSLVKLRLEESNRLLDAAVSLFPSRSSDALILLDKNGCLIKANGNVPSYLAARGIDFNTDNYATKILDENYESLLKSEDNWLESDWIQPVLENGEKLGSVICIPPTHRHVSDHKPRSSGFALSTDKVSFEDIIGSTMTLRKTIEKAKNLAISPVPVLIHGETGVGKEMFAKAIHAASKNRNGPLIILNCGGLSHELISSELFGHAEDAFTGAAQGGKIGKIEAADGGTLFLDEVGAMPLEIQTNILRFLQEGEICRLGENHHRKVNCRILAATNRDLSHDVKVGLFRKDLFYRISVVNLKIPVLRERKNDIAELARYFTQKIAERDEMKPKNISDEFIATLMKHDWPGNVRELRNIIESAIVMCNKNTLTAAHLPEEFQHQTVNDGQITLDNILNEQENLKLDDAERLVIVSTIKATNGNLTKTARRLGIAKSTLYLKLKKYNLDRDAAMSAKPAS